MCMSNKTIVELLMINQMVTDVGMFETCIATGRLSSTFSSSRKVLSLGPGACKACQVVIRLGCDFIRM